MSQALLIFMSAFLKLMSLATGKNPAKNHIQADLVEIHVIETANETSTKLIIPKEVFMDKERSQLKVAVGSILVSYESSLRVILKHAK